MGDSKSFFSGSFFEKIKEGHGRHISLYTRMREEWKKGLFFGVFIVTIWELFTKSDSTADAIAIALFYGPGERCLGTPLRWLHKKLMKLKVIPPSHFFLKKQPYKIYIKKEDNSDGCESCNNGCTVTRTKIIEPDCFACAFAMTVSYKNKVPRWIMDGPGHYWDVKIINRPPSNRVLQNFLEKIFPKTLSTLILMYLPDTLPYYYLSAHHLCKIEKLREGSIEIIDDVPLMEEDLVNIIDFFFPDLGLNILKRVRDNGRQEIREF